MTRAEMSAIHHEFGLSLAKTTDYGDHQERHVVGSVDGERFKILSGFDLATMTAEFYRRWVREEIEYLKSRLDDSARDSPQSIHG